MVADCKGVAYFDEAAALEDGDAVAEIADEGHGVGDEEIGEAVGALEGAEEVDDLGADGDVEGADGFVEDEEFGFEGEGAGDVDALALAAGELVGVTLEDVGFEADLVEEFSDAGADVMPGEAALDGEGLADDLADAHFGVEGGEGVLEDHLHAAAEGAELAGVGGEDVGGIEGDGAGGGLDEAQEHARDGGFAGAGFADEAEGFAAVEGEGDVVDDAGGAVELGEAGGGEEGLGAGLLHVQATRTCSCDGRPEAARRSDLARSSAAVRRLVRM